MEQGGPVNRTDEASSATAETGGIAGWSVVRGESPMAHAVEPGPISITVPDVILTWAEAHGLDEEDPDVYLLVTRADEAGAVIGQIAYREHSMPVGDFADLCAALDRR